MQRAQSLAQNLRLRVSALLQQEAAPACRWLSTAATEAASSAPEGVSILPRHQALKRALKPQASWSPPLAPPPSPPAVCFPTCALLRAPPVGDQRLLSSHCPHGVQNSGRNAFRRNWAKQLELKVRLGGLKGNTGRSPPHRPCLCCQACCAAAHTAAVGA